MKEQGMDTGGNMGNSNYVQRKIIWNEGLREAVMSPLMEIFKTQLDEVLSNMA